MQKVAVCKHNMYEIVVPKVGYDSFFGCIDLSASVVKIEDLQHLKVLHKVVIC